MNKFKNNSILLFIVSFFLISQVYSAFTPKKETSKNDKCYYKIEGKTSSWSSFDKDWFEVSCTENLNFSSLPNNIGSLPDGTYYLKLKGFDKNELGDVKSYDSELNTTVTNKYGIQTFGPYKIDTSAPKCLLKEIRFKAGESDNQYYNNGKIYYKKAGDAKGKFELVIESDDTIDGTNTSGIKEIQFPTILGATPTTQSFDTHTGKVLVTGFYSWSGEQNDTFDILNNSSKKFCFDNAGNNSFLKSDSNTKVIFEDGDQILTGLTSLILTPDGVVPSVDGVTLDNLTNGFKYKSGNLGEGSELSIYDGISSKTKYFAAFTGRTLIIPKFKDEGAGLKSFKINIENFNDRTKLDQYLKTASTKDTRLTLLTDLQVIHDFRNVYNDFDNNNGYRNYDWDIETLNFAGNKVKGDNICDMVGNCVSVTTPAFKVVANYPSLSNTPDDYCLGKNDTKGSKHLLNSDCKKYDGDNNNMRSNFLDTHTSLVHFRDMYGNPILPVSGVKKIELKIDFNNTMGCNQISITDREKGDCINFTFKNGTSQLTGNTHLVNEYKNFGFNLTEANKFLNGELIIELKSAIPTNNEYILKGSTKSLYGSGFNVELQLKNLNIIVSDVTSYKGTGENSPGGLYLATPNGNQPSYKWNPVITFDNVSNIYPLVEGQQKELNINSEVKDNPNVISYNLNTTYGTNNFFLQFNNTMLLTGSLVLGNEKYDIIGSGIYGGLNGYGSIYKSSNSYTGPGTEITTPKTIGGISGINTKIAYYANLNYFVKNAPSLITLPSIQTGFNNFGIHEIGDFLTSGNYSSDSDITFGEVDIRGITQTRNQAGTTTGTGAVTTTTNTFVDFSSISLYDIKTEVSKNVEKLLAGKNRNDGCVNTNCLQGNITLANLSTFPPDKGINLQNGQVLYFKNTDITIDCGLTCDISGKRTLIIENGNLIIKSNMQYTNNKSVLGIILIGNKYNGNKSQVRISENITNGVGIIYSDGPIISVNSSNIQYDGGNTGNKNLVNQLYWKGSFATKNTVGGSIKDGKGVCPYGTPDYQNSSCTIEKAQGYDLIYLRRYARVNKSLYGITNNPMGDGKVPINLDKFVDETGNGIKIAGGQEIKKINNLGIINPILPSLPQPSNYSTSEKAKNSPLIIEYDNALQTNTPIGFSK